MPAKRKGANLGRHTRNAAYKRNSRAQRTNEQIQQDNYNVRMNMIRLRQSESEGARAERNERRRLEQRRARRYIVHRRRANDQQRQQESPMSAQLIDSIENGRIQRKENEDSNLEVKNRIIDVGSGMEWTNNKILEFISIYEKHPLIWDPKNVNHKNRVRLADAWVQIQQEFNPDISITDLKKKKESLLSTYRLLKKKVIDSESAGEGPDGVYKPTWFAYNALDKFLKIKGKKEMSPDWEQISVKEEMLDDDEEMFDYPDTQTTEFFNASNNFEFNPGNQTAELTDGISEDPEMRQDGDYFCQSTLSRKRKIEAPSSTENLMAKHLRQTNQSLQSLKNEQKPDTYSLYGQLVAERIRELQPRTRLVVQNKIDNLLYNALLTQMDKNPSSPGSLETPSSGELPDQ